MRLSVILTITACLLAFVVCPVCADVGSAPALPVQFSGTLYNHEGKPFPPGTVITAEVNGVVSTYTVTESGKIGGSGTFDDKFLLSGVTVGSEITFKIEGTNVEVKHIYNPSSDSPASAQQFEEIQLTIPVKIPGSSGGNSYYSPGTSTVTPTVTPTPPTEPEDEDTQSSPTEEPKKPETPEEPASPFPLSAVLFALAGAGLIRRR